MLADRRSPRGDYLVLSDPIALSLKLRTPPLPVTHVQVGSVYGKTGFVQIALSKQLLKATFHVAQSPNGCIESSLCPIRERLCIR